MKRLNSQLIGIDQGDVILFSDFDNDGPMWVGTGPRMVRHQVNYSGEFLTDPAVTVSLSMVDIANGSNYRTDIQAENITTSSFDIVFRTWENTKIARVRASWQAIGELHDADHWQV